MSHLEQGQSALVQYKGASFPNCSSPSILIACIFKDPAVKLLKFADVTRSLKAEDRGEHIYTEPNALQN